MDKQLEKLMDTKYAKPLLSDQVSRLDGKLLKALASHASVECINDQDSTPSSESEEFFRQPKLREES